MLFRALFWITLVAVLMPHEPNLGLGRPSMAGSLSGLISNTSDARPPQMERCADDAKSCGPSLDVVEGLQGSIMRGLIDVKSEIEQAERARRAGS